MHDVQTWDTDDAWNNDRGTGLFVLAADAAAHEAAAVAAALAARDEEWRSTGAWQRMSAAEREQGQQDAAVQYLVSDRERQDSEQAAYDKGAADAVARILAGVEALSAVYWPYDAATDTYARHLPCEAVLAVIDATQEPTCP